MKKYILFSAINCLAFFFLSFTGFAVGNSVPKALAVRIDKVIEKAHARPLRSDVNTPWVVMQWWPLRTT